MSLLHPKPQNRHLIWVFSTISHILIELPLFFAFAKSWTLHRDIKKPAPGKQPCTRRAFLEPFWGLIKMLVLIVRDFSSKFCCASRAVTGKRFLGPDFWGGGSLLMSDASSLSLHGDKNTRTIARTRKAESLWPVRPTVENFVVMWQSQKCNLHIFPSSNRVYMHKTV